MDGFSASRPIPEIVFEEYPEVKYVLSLRVNCEALLRLQVMLAAAPLDSPSGTSGGIDLVSDLFKTGDGDKDGAATPDAGRQRSFVASLVIDPQEHATATADTLPPRHDQRLGLTTSDYAKT